MRNAVDNTVLSGSGMLNENQFFNLKQLHFRIGQINLLTIFFSFLSTK